MPTTDPHHRFRLTPGHCLLALLAVEFLLFLSQWFRWLPKGWPVLIAVASVGVVVLGMFVWFGVAVVFGRRFQFSVRSLLVLTVAVALLCSWFAVEMKKAREQKAVVAEIDEHWGTVYYDYATQNEPGRDLPLRGVQSLMNVFGDDFFVEVVEVDLRNSRLFANADLERLQKLSRLDILCLTNSDITDAELEPLKGLHQLHELELTETLVTDEGVAKLQKALPNCKITR